MARIVRSSLSEVDVFEIALYIAQDNSAAAYGLIDTFEEKLLILAHSPLAGRPRPELARGLRSFPVGEYIIFYRPLPDGIELARILHGARNIRRKVFRTP